MPLREESSFVLSYGSAYVAYPVQNDERNNAPLHKFENSSQLILHLLHFLRFFLLRIFLLALLGTLGSARALDWRNRLLLERLSFNSYNLYRRTQDDQTLRTSRAHEPLMKQELVRFQIFEH